MEKRCLLHVIAICTVLTACTSEKPVSLESPKPAPNESTIPSEASVTIVPPYLNERPIMPTKHIQVTVANDLLEPDEVMPSTFTADVNRGLAPGLDVELLHKILPLRESVVGYRIHSSTNTGDMISGGIAHLVFLKDVTYCVLAVGQVRSSSSLKWYRIYRVIGQTYLLIGDIKSVNGVSAFRAEKMEFTGAGNEARVGFNLKIFDGKLCWNDYVDCW